MTKITMPDPVAYRWCIPRIGDNGQTLGYSDWILGGNHEFPHHWPHESLITTDQAEAYADAKVREALQEAGTVADNWAMRHCDDASAEIWAGEAIRALIKE